MWQKDHRKSKKACVPRSAFEEEPQEVPLKRNLSTIHSMTTMTMVT